jgi:ubiquinone/menaquinone biosynthesis C-methylase UbiE
MRMTALAVVLALAGGAGCRDTPNAAGGAGATFRGRTIARSMTFDQADWLDRAERAERDQPDRVVESLALSPGDTVADIGAGTGYFTLRLARKVGRSGRVFATDIDPAMLARLKERVLQAGLDNVVLVQATDSDAKLPPAAIDLALMVDVYHELSHPAETLAQVRRALRPGGRLTVVEYRREDPSVPIKPTHEMTLAQIESEIEPEGYRLATVLEFLPQQHLVTFARSP